MKYHLSELSVGAIEFFLGVIIAAVIAAMLKLSVLSAVTSIMHLIGLVALAFVALCFAVAISVDIVDRLVDPIRPWYKRKPGARANPMKGKQSKSLSLTADEWH